MTWAILGAVAIAGYLWAMRTYRRRFPQRAFPASRAAFFAAGVVAMVAALSPPADALADRSFTAHMFQHLVMTLAGPPLVLLGAPLLLCVALPPASVARRIARATRAAPVHLLLSPAAAWLGFVAVLWVVHFSPVYEAALTHAWVHGVEHALFIATAFLFWMTVVQVGYAPRALAFPGRLFLLFLTIPQGAFLGVAIYASGRVLYPHYAAAHPFAQTMLDQRGAGAAMWIGGGLALFVAFLVTAAVWASHERGEAVASS